MSPARRGDFEISVELEDAHEKPLAASAVSITLSDQKRGSSPVIANAERVRDDKWRVRMSAPTSGTWLLSLSVRTSPADQIEIAAPIVINWVGIGETVRARQSWTSRRIDEFSLTVLSNRLSALQFHGQAVLAILAAFALDRRQIFDEFREVT